MPYQQIVSRWRSQSNRVIWGVLRENGVKDGHDALSLSDKQKNQIIKAVSKAYPFGARENHPYKIWCSEVHRVLGGLYIKKKVDLRPEANPNNYQSRVLIDDPRQMRFL